MKLEDELKLYGCYLDPSQFEEILADVFAGMCAGMNDEGLLYRPSDAVRYCQAIRARTSDGLPEEMILRRLINMRKSSRAPKKKR